MAELVFFSGTMDSGKSTLALQMEHNHRARGKGGLIFTKHDRAGEAVVSSRLGLSRRAIEVTDTLDFWDTVVGFVTEGHRVDFVVCDEAQFYTRDHVDQLARIVDELQLDVYAFGILADFRTTLFPGSQRLVELADRVETLPLGPLCWCGAKGTHNARTVDGLMVTEGSQVVVGDTAEGGEVRYEVLCRAHHRRRMTAFRAKATLSPDPLPFDLET